MVQKFSEFIMCFPVKWIQVDKPLEKDLVLKGSLTCLCDFAAKPVVLGLTRLEFDCLIDGLRRFFMIILSASSLAMRKKTSPWSCRMPKLPPITLLPWRILLVQIGVRQHD